MPHCVRSVWENHEDLNNKGQVSMQTWKNKKVLDNTIRRTFAHANSFNFADKQHFKVFRLSFLETIPIFFIRLKKWFYPCLIVMKFSPLNDFGLNSRDNLFNKKSSKWLKLILSSVRMLLNITFRCLEILIYFLSCDPENSAVISPPV